MRIGHSYDIHRLEKGRDLILGGKKFDHHLGLLGHSDADVLTHVIIESIIGALGFGDIGTLFPDTDNKYKNISSMVLLEETKNIMLKHKYTINNLDATIYLEEPIINPYINEIRNNIATILNVSPNIINIKATRGERLGFIGRQEGIAAECVVLLKKNFLLFKKKKR